MINNLFFDHDGIGEGTFLSNVFLNDGSNELIVYIENDSAVKYAEQCIEHFNSMQDEMIDYICNGILKCAKQDGLDEEIELESTRDILKYCWFVALYIDVPTSDKVTYRVEGEGDWGECIGFIIKENEVAYIGNDIFSEEV